jgi:hypothetical protein
MLMHSDPFVVLIFQGFQGSAVTLLGVSGLRKAFELVRCKNYVLTALVSNTDVLIVMLIQHFDGLASCSLTQARQRI